VEGVSERARFEQPKWYSFADEEKHKGRTKESKVVKEDSDELVVEQEEWEGLKKALTDDDGLGTQIVNTVLKEFSKTYYGGRVGEDGKITAWNKKHVPYINELEEGDRGFLDVHREEQRKLEEKHDKDPLEDIDLRHSISDIYSEVLGDHHDEALIDSSLSKSEQLDELKQLTKTL